MRHDENLCRLCAKYSKNMATIQLFERAHKSVLRRIFLLAGIKLKNQKSHPSVICTNCELELNRAFAFRERCITAQAYFSTEEYKAQSIKDCEENCDEPDIQCSKSDILKLEITPCSDENATTAADTDLASEPEPHSINDDTTKPSEYTPEFIALKEEINGIYVHGNEDDMMDHELEYEKVAHTDTDSENPIKDKERLEKVIPTPAGNEYKSDANKKDKQKTKKIKSKAREKQGTRKPKIYICDQCGNNFTCRTHLYTHIKRHTGIKPLQCEVCPDKFFTEAELKRHMRRHTGERPFPCKHCDRRFADYSTRIRHERTHTNERPFKCDQCGKAFTTSYVLKNHKIVHTGERSYECTLCKKYFTLQTHLVVHTRTLTHKQNAEREQFKMAQLPKVEGAESCPLENKIKIQKYKKF